MIRIHHLNHSRSQRILWLLEELGLDYEIVFYTRDSETRLAPPELKGVHPLGKSPVLEDGDVKIAESAAIVDYLVRTYGGGRFGPAVDDPAYTTYNEWLHYAEGSAVLPLILSLYVRRLGEAGAPLQPRISGEIGNNLAYMAASLGEKSFFVGDSLTGADIMLTFILEAASLGGALEHFPNLKAYLGRMQAREAYKKAIEKGGPYQLGA